MQMKVVAMISAEVVQSQREHRKPGSEELADYVSHARQIANDFIRRKRHSANFDDIHSDALQALVEAWHRYNPEKQACFKTYSEHYIKGQLLRWQDNHVKYNIFFTVTDPQPSEETSVFDKLTSESDMCADPYCLSQREEVIELLEKARAKAELSTRETAVLELWMDGQSVTEIATEMGINHGYVNRAMISALNKLRTVILNKHNGNP
jgi:RNA polymerase sigma factor (sigma-70 family)